MEFIRTRWLNWIKSYELKAEVLNHLQRRFLVLESLCRTVYTEQFVPSFQQASTFILMTTHWFRHRSRIIVLNVERWSIIGFTLLSVVNDISVQLWLFFNTFFVLSKTSRNLVAMKCLSCKFIDIDQNDWQTFMSGFIVRTCQSSDMRVLGFCLFSHRNLYSRGKRIFNKTTKKQTRFLIDDCRFYQFKSNWNFDGTKRWAKNQPWIAHDIISFVRSSIRPSVRLCEIVIIENQHKSGT